MIHQHTFSFLEQLRSNNNRPWFEANRSAYDTARENFIDFCENLLKQLQTIQEDLHQTEVKKCINRIYRDIRFKKDKTPYKTNFGAGFGPGGKSSGRADFYIQLEPGNKSFLGGGMWNASAEELQRWRQEIDYNAQELKGIINDPAFIKAFPSLEGAKLKTKPKGYEMDHPEIELLRHKDFFFLAHFEDNEVLCPHFGEKVFERCKVLKPFLDYVNYILYDQVLDME